MFVELPEPIRVGVRLRSPNAETVRGEASCSSRLEAPAH